MEKRSVKFKRHEVMLFLNKGLSDSKKLNGCNNWKYAIFKNSKACESEVEAYPKECMSELEQARLDLCNRLCEKDNLGKPVVEDGKYKINDMNEFNSEYSKVFEALKPKIEEYNKFLNGVVDLDIYVLDKDELSSELLPEMMDNISWMID